MKKIFALALAAVMTAGMTTVAFAATGDKTPVVGIAEGNGATAYNRAFVLNDEGYADAGLDPTTILEGGDEIAIPIAIQTEGVSVDWFDRDYDYKTSNVKAYADWDDVEGDAEGDVDLRWVKYVGGTVGAGEMNTAAGYYYSVVITVPENNGDKLLDLVGKVSVGRTTTAARNAANSVAIETTFGPDGTDDFYTVDFDGGILDAGTTGIVDFDKNADEIDIEFGEQALFTVDVTGQDKLNLAWTTKFDSEFAAYYDYANLDFLTFKGEPAFNRTGDFYIYADEDAFVYEVTADGAKELDAEWDEDYEAWRFRTRKLTSYVISDVELDEKTVTEDKDDTSSTTDGGKENPDTGR